MFFRENDFTSSGSCWISYQCDGYHWDMFERDDLPSTAGFVGRISHRLMPHVCCENHPHRPIIPFLRGMEREISERWRYAKTKGHKSWWPSASVCIGRQFYRDVVSLVSPAEVRVARKFTALTAVPIKPSRHGVVVRKVGYLFCFAFYFGIQQPQWLRLVSVRHFGIVTCWITSWGIKFGDFWRWRYVSRLLDLRGEYDETFL